MTIIQAIIMGAVQGITEFLPVSSSGHLVLIPWLVAWEDPGLAFDVLLHFGTLVALVVYFFHDWCRLLKAGLSSVIERKVGFDRDRQLFWYLVLATIPAVLVGLLLHEQAATLLRSPLLVAIALAVVGFFLYYVDDRSPAIKNLKEVGLKQAMWIGLFQAMAIIPGVSRSGITMLGGRLLYFKREAAARFSFFLAVPVIFGACVFEAKSMISAMSDPAMAGYYIAGFLSSLVFGFASIHFLLMYLRVASFKLFAWYRIVLAAIIVILSLF